MKTFKLLLFLIPFFYIPQLNAQTKKQKCIIHFNLSGINILKAKIYLQKFQPDSNEIYRTIKTIIVDKEQFTSTLILDEPLLGFVKLVQNDLKIIQSGSCIFSNEQMAVRNDNSFFEIKSEQTNFHQLHLNQSYLQPPFSLKASKNYSYDKIKRSYVTFIPEDYSLNAKQLEYERDLLDQVKLHKNMFTTLYGLYNLRTDLSLKTLEACYSILFKEFNNSEYIHKLKTYIENSKNIFIGKVLPSFNVVDSHNQQIFMNRFYSNYEFVLIDFWASWCVPCRKEMKIIKEVYSLLDTLKFKIISISLDKEKEKWQQAIKQDGINWTNYYDSLAFNSNVAKTFNLSFIPNNLLVNSKGEIIDLNFNAEKLKIFIKRNYLHTNNEK